MQSLKLFSLCFLLFFSLSSANNYFPLAEWKWLDFDFGADSTAASAYFNTKTYENIVVTGIKVWNPPLGLLPNAFPITFVSCPRWKDAGISAPGTLNTVDFTRQGRGGGPLLVPFPSSAMNVAGDNAQLQNVLGFDIDPVMNYLYILDQGRLGSQNATAGAIKLIIWDLVLNIEVQRHVFDPSVAPLNSAFLNDLVIDQSRSFVYITDTGRNTDGVDSHLRGGLVVYDIVANTARRVLDRDASTQADFSFDFQVLGRQVLPGHTFIAGADGIALTPDGLFLFWTPLSSNRLYRIPTCYLRDSSLAPAQLSAQVELAAVMPSNADGISFSNLIHPPLTAAILAASGPSPNQVCRAGDLKGATVYELITGGLGTNAVYSWRGDLSRLLNGSSAVSVELTTLAQDSTQLVWPDTFSFVGDGSIAAITNHLNTWTDGSMDFSQVNFRLMIILPPSPAQVYQSYALPGPTADSFTYFDKSSDCRSIPFAAHVTIDPAECLYTPPDKNSFALSCAYDPATNIATANVQAFTGNGCNATQRFSAFPLNGDGKSCLSLGTASGLASCHNAPPAIIKPLLSSQQNSLTWFGYVDDCSSPNKPLVTHIQNDGECTQTANDGLFLKVTCETVNGITVAKVGNYDSPDCAAAAQIASAVGLANGEVCIPVTHPIKTWIRLGSATVHCPTTSHGQGENGDDDTVSKKSAIIAGIVSAIIAAVVVLIIVGIVIKYRRRSVSEGDININNYHMARP
jgi:hypothetical protein